MVTRKELYGVAIVVLGAIILLAYTISVRRDATAEAKIEAIHQELKAGLEAIQKDKETVHTPAQVAAAVPKYTPDVKPILIVPGGVPTQTQAVDGQISQISLPDAPSAITAGSLVIPTDQVPAYWKSVTKCAEDNLNLGACQKELEQEKKKHSFWDRAWNCGVSVGTNAGSGAAYGGRKGAIVGVGFGALGCVLQRH